MARTTAGHIDGSVKFQCSYCGVPRFFPAEMQRLVDGTFRCDWHGNETTTNLEQARIAAASKPRDQETPRFPTGVPAEWQS